MVGTRGTSVVLPTPTATLTSIFGTAEAELGASHTEAQRVSRARAGSSFFIDSIR